MSKQGCLNRIKTYRDSGNITLLEQEEAYYEANYSTPKKEKVKKSKD